MMEEVLAPIGAAIDGWITNLQNRIMHEAHEIENGNEPDIDSIINALMGEILYDLLIGMGMIILAVSLFTSPYTIAFLFMLDVLIELTMPLILTAISVTIPSIDPIVQRFIDMVGTSDFEGAIEGIATEAGILGDGNTRTLGDAASLVGIGVTIAGIIVGVVLKITMGLASTILSYFFAIASIVLSIFTLGCFPWDDFSSMVWSSVAVGLSVVSGLLLIRAKFCGGIALGIGIGLSIGSAILSCLTLGDVLGLF